MSIVERAAAKLRQENPGSGQQAKPQVAPTPTPPPRDHIAAAGQKAGAKRPQAAPAATVKIDFDELRRQGMMPPAATQDQVTKEYQRIKRQLLVNVNTIGVSSGIADANRFMVASAIPGEGKTFTSFNLALSLAKEKDYTVLLVDGDVPKPAISRALGLHKHPGLSDILADDALLPADVVVATNVPGLSVLPAGRQHKEAPELFSSQRMAWLMGELSRDPNRILLFDSPPLLATAEAQSLAMAMGQVLVVVKAGSTDQKAVMAALSLIEAPDRSVSLILNQSTKAHGDHYAGYYGLYNYYGQEARV
ncbi:MAG TPA: AAA family ATPase [Salinisphaeraceae bacterium]|nr:AAA family ATPase [Salinisphaeraceae bacterium]